MPSIDITEDIVYEYLNTTSVRALADRLGVSRNYLYSRMWRLGHMRLGSWKTQGHPKRARPLTADQEDWLKFVRRLRAKNVTLEEIGRRMGSTRQAVSSRLKILEGRVNALARQQARC